MMPGGVAHPIAAFGSGYRTPKIRNSSREERGRVRGVAYPSSGPEPSNAVTHPAGRYTRLYDGYAAGACGLYRFAEHEHQSNDDHGHAQHTQRCQLIAKDQVIHDRSHGRHQVKQAGDIHQIAFGDHPVQQ